MATQAQSIACYEGVVDYDPLPSCSIRVIVLESGSPDEPVEASMRSVCLETVEANKIQYNALSYHWSFEGQTFPVVLNEKPVKITEHLGKLFDSVRAKLQDDEASWWWVDQLCIDQNSSEDKAQQVPKMRTIYEKAARVMIWLTPGFEDCNYAVTHIQRLARWAQTTTSQDLVAQFPLADILGRLDDKDNMRSWRAVERLISHPYWNRTWIFPEATANIDNTFVRCCDESGAIALTDVPLRNIFWFRMQLRAIWSRRPPAEYQISDAPTEYIARLSNFSEMRHGHDPAGDDLLSKLQVIRRTRCTRPEDKIYAMLPFGIDAGDFSDDPFIKPDYVHGAARAYTNLVKWYIMRYRNLNFMGYVSCPYREWQILDPNMKPPSWVPNWTHLSFHDPLAKCYNPTDPSDDRKPLYSACGPFSHSLPLAESISTECDTEALLVSGVKIAFVNKALEPVYATDGFDSTVEESWMTSIDTEAKYPLTGERFEEAMLRTMVADTSWDAYRGKTVTRPGRAMWWAADSSLTAEESARREFTLKRATRDRTIFFAGPKDHTLDPSSFLLGLGPHNTQPGDEIWALKGGSTMFVLRHKSQVVTVNTTSAQPQNGLRFPNISIISEELYPHNAVLELRAYELVGECYVHGLTDGEIFEYMERPADDDRSSQESGTLRSSKAVSEQSDTVKIEEGTPMAASLPSPVVLSDMYRTFSDILVQ